MPVKMKIETKIYYIFINKYIMHNNEKKYLKTKKQNIIVKLKNEKSQKSLCYKSMKQKILKTYSVNKQIFKNNFTKKKSKKKINNVMSKKNFKIKNVAKNKKSAATININANDVLIA